MKSERKRTDSFSPSWALLVLYIRTHGEKKWLEVPVHTRYGASARAFLLLFWIMAGHGQVTSLATGDVFVTLEVRGHLWTQGWLKPGVNSR